ncbi:MAG: SCO family protein [Bacillus sp. (in: firmicutes)]
MKKLYITFIILLIISIGAGIYYFTDYRESKMSYPNDLILYTHKGEDFSFDHLTPKVRLIEFMYTECPDICPATTYLMAQLRDELEEEGVFGEKVEFLTISIDPEKDTQEVLQQYATLHTIDKTDGWYLLSGTKPNIRELTNNFQFQFREAGTGDFVHRSATYLLDQENRVVKVFGMGQNDFDKAAVFKKIMAEI